MTAKRFFHGAAKTGLWVLSILLLMLVLLQIAIGSAVLWLRGEGGRAWLEARVDSALEGSGYEAAFSGLAYTFPRGLHIKRLSVSGPDGPLAEAEGIALRTSLLNLPLKRLGLGIDIRRLTLHGLPGGKEEDKEPGAALLSPFTLPDLYFNSFGLNLDIGTLDLPFGSDGERLALSPKLRGTLSLDEILSLSLDLAPGQLGENRKRWLPENIFLSAILDPRTLDLSLSRLELKSPYNISAAGHANLGESGALDIALEGESGDLSDLAPGAGGAARLAARIGGTLAQPGLSAHGNLDLATLRKRGFGPILFAAEDANLREDPLGRLSLESLYKSHPVALAADLRLEENSLILSNIAGQTPELRLTGAASLSTDTWRAAGELRLSADDLRPYGELAGKDLAGKVEAAIALRPAEGAQAATIEADLFALRYEGYTLDSGHIIADVPDIKTYRQPAEMTLRGSGLHLSEMVRLENFTASVLQETKESRRLSLDLKGQAMQPFSLHGSAMLHPLENGDFAAQNIDLALISEGSRLTMGGAASREALDLTLQTSSLALASIPLTMPQQLRSITLSGTAQISGAPANPVIVTDLAASPFSPAPGASVRISLNATYADGNAQARFSGAGTGIQTLQGRAALPVSLSLYPFALTLEERAPLSGALSLEAAADELSPVLLPPGHDLSGALAMEAELGGTRTDPDLTGTLSLTGGAYRYQTYGVDLLDLGFKATLGPDALTVTELSATDGGSGRLSGSGRIGLADRSQTAIALDITDYRLFNSARADGTLSADLTLRGREEGYLAAGDIRLGRIDVTIPERFRTDIPTLNIVEDKGEDLGREAMADIALDLRVVAENRIFVRGWGLDAELDGMLLIGGALDDPQFNGELSLVRGRYEEFGRRFDLERAALRFQGSVPPSPFLDILATTQLEDLSASVQLSGEFEDPALSFSSVPPLPDDEILSRILFGRDLSNITPLQAIRLKQTLDRFRGRGGGFDPLGQLRALTGLDDIRVDTEGEETTVGVGKYITDNVYLELEKGQAEGSGGAKVQVEVTPRLSVESEVGRDAEAGASMLWRWDY